MQNAIGILMHWTKQSHMERERCVVKFYERCLLAGRAGTLAVSWLCWRREKTVVLSVQFSLVSQSCLTLCDPMNCSMPGLPVHHQLPKLAQTHVHRVGDAIQPSHLLSSPSPPAFSLSQHQSLFQWVSSLHQVAKGLEFQFRHLSFHWTFRTDFL